MLKKGKSIDNYESQSLVAKTHDNRFNSSSPIFILCGKCYWCTKESSAFDYDDKLRIKI